MTNITLDEVERLAMQLSPSEQLRLLEDVARRLRQSGPNRAAGNLSGDQNEMFPLDVDADAIAAESSAAAVTLLPPEDFSDWEK